jgi:hypothetical protein
MRSRDLLRRPAAQEARCCIRAAARLTPEAWHHERSTRPSAASGGAQRASAPPQGVGVADFWRRSSSTTYPAVSLGLRSELSGPEARSHAA